MTRHITAIRESYELRKPRYRKWHCLDCARPPTLKTFWHERSNLMLWMGIGRCARHRIIYATRTAFSS